MRTDRLVRRADRWWDSLPPERRVQIHRWVDGPDPHDHEPIEGQMDIWHLLPKGPK